MEHANNLFLLGSLLLFLSIIATTVSVRFGLPMLLVFLAVGMLAGEDGPGQVRFNDFDMAFLVGNLALAVILLDGGLRTRIQTFRVALRPAAALATVGVLATAGLVALAVKLLTSLDWPHALLLGAIVGSTDAAAVFSVLRNSGTQLNERVSATLEIESGANDPMAIFLVLVLLEWISVGQSRDAGSLLLMFVQQFGLGAIGGVAGGLLLARLLERITLSEGLYALLVLSGGLLLFALVNKAGGSGFLAIYLAGLVVGNRGARSLASVLPVMDGLAWLAQAGMFLLLGLLVTPTALLADAPLALAIAAVLILLARPLAVWLSLLPFRFPRREVAFISWIGLRGAVPVVLAIFPVVNGVPHALLLFDIAFVVVLASLLVQGSSVGWVAHKLGVALPLRAATDAVERRKAQAFFGEFMLSGAAQVRDVAAVYGLALDAEGEQTLADYLGRALGKRVVVGDRVVRGSVTLTVEELVDGRVTRVGIRLG